MRDLGHFTIGTFDPFGNCVECGGDGQDSAVPRPVVVVVVIAVVALLTTPARAHADPAEPTDYLSEVVDVSPPVEGIEVAVVGGDAFLELVVLPGHAVAVLGYEGEPFGRVSADGRVEENHMSPSWVLSRERFPSGGLPDEVRVDAEPVWVEVATNGTWVWHDHRAHWMGADPPMGSAPGDQVADGIVPMVVDGVEVEVRVVSTWLQPPSPWPARIGAVTGALVTSLVLLFRRRWLIVVGGLAAGAAAAVGFWEFVSIPSAAGPRTTSWLLPAAALVALVVEAVVERNGRPAPYVALGATLFAGAELGLWAWQRRSGLVHAVLPTDAPWWLDRGVTAFVAPVAVGLAALTVARALSIARPTGRPLGQPRASM